MNTEARRVGRPPGPHEDTLDKLLPTALRLFLDEGGAALTPTRLHRETGIARATIYRNWPEPADLIEIMLGYATEQPDDALFSDELTDDLLAAVDTLLDRFEHRPARAFFAACLEYGRRSPRVARAAEAFIKGILAPIRTVIQREVDRGALLGDVDDLVADVAGPLVLQHVVMGEPVSRQRGHRLVHDLVARRTPPHDLRQHESQA